MSPGFDADGSLGFLSNSPPIVGIVSQSLPISAPDCAIAVCPGCVTVVCASANDCTFFLTEIFGKSSLYSDSEPLFSNRRPVFFRCFSVAIHFVARSLTSRGIGGGRIACGTAIFVFYFRFWFRGHSRFSKHNPII